MGPEIKTLLTQLQVQHGDGSVPCIQMRMAKHHVDDLPIEQVKYSFPDVQSPRAHQTVHRLIPSMAIDAIYYCDCVSNVRYNVRLICADMHRTGYPNAWWQPNGRRQRC